MKTMEVRWILPMVMALLLVLVPQVGCHAPQVAPARSAEGVEAEVRRALGQFNDAAAAGDVKGCLTLFEDRADILLVGSDKGEVFKGPAAMEGWLTALLRNNRFSWEMDRVDISHHGDTAWAFVEGRMVVKDPTGKLRFKAPYRFSAVLVRRGDGWAWRLFHGSAPGKE